MSRDRSIAMLGILAAVALAIGACRSAQVSHPVVVFDESHGQRFLVGQQGGTDLSMLADLFRSEGLQVRSSREPVSTQALAGVDALVISGPFAPLTPGEIEATLGFIDRGGRLSVMLHIAPPAAALLQSLHVSISNGVIRERENLIGTDPLNFHLTRLTPHPLTKGLEQFDAFGVWALLSTSDNAAVIAQTSPNAWVDLNGNHVQDAGDAVQSLGVVVAGRRGKGRFAAFGDDAIFQNQFLVGGNAVLARNLARFLDPAT